jgi:hypothetical protein
VLPGSQREAEKENGNKRKVRNGEVVMSWILDVVKEPNDSNED